jgi:hypothetical protein
MVRACGDQVRGIGRESAIPNPALVTGEGRLQLERNGRSWLGAGSRGLRVDGGVRNLPDLGGVVGGAGGQVLDVWGEEDASNVLGMGLEVGDRDERGLLTVLNKVPDENVALGRISCA